MIKIEIFISKYGYPEPGYNRLGWSITVKDDNVDFIPI
tara:strand:+ start:78 stop:191 length:114 start_codon:yes stop_codon:yes gene_type:complete